MKSILKAAIFAAIFGSPWIAFSQQYYLVIGAFETEGNVSEFKGYLPVQAADTSYTFTENENLFHLYIFKTSDKEAISRTLLMKGATESSETTDNAMVGSRSEIDAANPLLNEKSPPSMGREPDFGSASAAGSEEQANLGRIPARPRGKLFKFLIENPAGTPLPGKVHQVDFENERELATYNANTFVDLLQPGNSSQPMAVVCGLFGYKEVQKYIDYSNPSSTDEDAFVDAEGTWVIPYKLQPLEKGDVSVMYNVSFYKDAVVMRQPSKTDLDELVKMMRDNPYYEIKIHAHCNGKNKRQIIALGSNRNYFDVTGSIMVDGSAKELTTFRAKAIQSYLADHGIDSSRTKIFSWGGADRLVKENSPQAALNDRIEIEITRD